MYKILSNTFSFPESIITLRSRFKTHPMSTRYVSTNTLYTPYAHTNSFMNSFVLSTSTLWNGLPSVITCLSTISSFKKTLDALVLAIYMLNVHLIPYPAQCYSVAKVHIETACLASEQAHSFTNLLNYVQVI